MKNHHTSSARKLGRLVASGGAAVLLSCLAAGGQTIPNPSFETDTFSTFPGYISGNAPITGWTGTPETRVGLNPGGGSPFANNGLIPDGTKVAFIQSDPGTPSTLSTTISDLTPGTTYRVTFRANARGGNTPNVKVYLDGTPVWLSSGADGFSTAAVGGSNPYWYVAFDFTAYAASHALALVNDATGDQTLCVDDFKIAPSTGKWAIESWSYDGDSGVDPLYLYTHAYNFGSGLSPVINGITFTGAGGGGGVGPAVAGRFSTTYLTAGPVGDVFNNVSGNSAVMAAAFVYGGNVPANGYQSISLQGLTPGEAYVVTIYSVAWEDPNVANRWVTYSVGNDYLTLNQDQFYDNNGIRISYSYTADPDGTKTIKFSPLVPANLSFHVYGFANRKAVSSFAAPTISSQPKSMTVSPGLAVNLDVSAAGVPLPTYQWRFNGGNIAGATDATLAFPSVAAGDAGNYTVVVANQAGSVTSTVARLTVGLPMNNPSFEVDTFLTFPGYVSANGPITGWASMPRHGINPAAGSPFANNGTTPHGNQVAFLQDDGAMNQTVSGLTVGEQYYVHYYENSRSGYAVPTMQVQVGGITVVGTHPVPAVGSGSYHEITSEAFTATATDLELAFIKGAAQSGDSTAVIDNVAVLPLAAGTKPAMTLQPKSVTVFLGQAASFTGRALGSVPVTYQWRLDGAPLAGATSTLLALPAVQFADEGDYTLVASNGSGSVTSAVARLSLLETIPSLHNSGIDASGLPIAGGSLDPAWTFATNPDGGAASVYVGSAIPGAWLANDTTSKWIGSRANLTDGAIPLGDYTYRATFDMTGRDTNSVIIIGRWASDNWGTPVRVNGVAVDVPPSFNFNSWTTFTLASSNATFLPGLNTLDFVVNNAGNGPGGLRLEFTLVSARTLPGIAPAIAVPPQGRTVAEGDTVQLTVGATGTLPLSYQWQKDNVDLAGKTDAALTLTAVTTNDSGNYRVTASNAWGTATSASALVTVAYRPLPGVFGTGLAADGTLLGDGAVDPHYALSTSPDANFPGPDALVITNVWPIQAGVWVVNGPNSRWIAPSSAQRQDLDPTQGNAPGQYIYQTEFDLTGYDLSRVGLVGSWAADNSGTDIMVNGVSTGITCPGFAALTPFLITKGLVAGLNTLDFVMLNDPNVNDPASPNPTGLRVDLKAYLYLLEPIQIQITHTGAELAIGWSPAFAGQKLLSAPAVTGPWTEVPNAANPYLTPANGTERYFRVAQ
jgi:hypothetical protein